MDAFPPTLANTPALAPDEYFFGWDLTPGGIVLASFSQAMCQIGAVLNPCRNHSHIVIN